MNIYEIHNEGVNTGKALALKELLVAMHDYKFLTVEQVKDFISKKITEMDNENYELQAKIDNYTSW